MRVALFSAFPHELREIVKNIGAAKTLKTDLFDVSYAVYSSHEIIVVRTGIGVRNAEDALNYVLEKYNPNVIISAGFGGALFEGARIGEVIWASRVFFVSEGTGSVLDLQNGRDLFERLSGELTVREGSVLTLDRWKKKSELRKMVSGEFPFPVCDMETFPLAKLSLERNVRFFAIRAITDRNDEDIPPELLGVADESGHYRLSRALKLLLSRPGLIPGSIKLGIHSKIAGRNLWQAVGSLIEIL
jgi:adenosylhomocysteine nucleosidase